MIVHYRRKLITMGLFAELHEIFINEKNPLAAEDLLLFVEQEREKLMD